ncbi:MAG: PGF-CTERM sorting domain-containing protein [Halohasta sp.]
MNRSRYRCLLISVVVLLMIGSLAAPVAYADEHDDESDRVYQIVQDDEVVSVDPIEGSESVEKFYDYRHPHVGSRDDPQWGRSFSSEGTVDYQEDDASVLLLYEGSEGVSLVAVHDKYHESKSEGTTGGSVSWTVSGLPDDGEWAVIDDEYGWLTPNETQDDRFYFDPAHRDGAPGTDGRPPGDADARLSWVWTTSRNDGVAYRGLDSDAQMRIDPAFNEDSYHRYGDERRPDVSPDEPEAGAGYNGTVDDWQVIVPTDDKDGDDGEDFERVSLESLEEPVEIRSTSTPPAPESVSLENETIEPGESARLTATVENPGDVDWTYEASFRVGDTELGTETVTVPAGEERTVEFTQEFSSTGTYDVGVGDEQTTLTVEDTDEGDGADDAPDDSEDTDGADDADDEVPGFGPLAAVAALLAVALAASYRGRRLD